VLGTARTNNQSAGIAQATVQLIETLPGYSSELVAVADHITAAVTVPPWGEGGASQTPTVWQSIVQKSHALVLVVPEYNHSFPGELKLLLDSLWDDYEHKAVGIIGVSAGTLGAARVVDHIKPVLIELKLHPIKENVHISKVNEALTANGTFAHDETSEHIATLVHEITALSNALSALSAD
jgi:NAD(P)H-dependent FMN reductase